VRRRHPGYRRRQGDHRHRDPDHPAGRPRLPLHRAGRARDAVRRCRAGGWVRSRAHRAPPRAAEPDGAVPDHADVIPRPGHPARGLAVVPGARRAGADPGRGTLQGAASEYAERAPWIPASPAWRSAWPSSPSTCSATR
jgi:hypothetical protein